MKLSNKYIAFAGVALLMASCDLDKFPEGDYISEEQKEDIINGRPNLITAEVNAMAAKLNTFGTISDDATTYHRFDKENRYKDTSVRVARAPYYI
jgi:starch-binding outer membrane protein, SusD/RagB family